PARPAAGPGACATAQLASLSAATGRGLNNRGTESLAWQRLFCTSTCTVAVAVIASVWPVPPLLQVKVAFGTAPASSTAVSPSHSTWSGPSSTVICGTKVTWASLVRMQPAGEVTVTSTGVELSFKLMACVVSPVLQRKVAPGLPASSSSVLAAQSTVSCRSITGGGSKSSSTVSLAEQ